MDQPNELFALLRVAGVEAVQAERPGADGKWIVGAKQKGKWRWRYGVTPAEATDLLVSDVKAGAP